MQISLEVCDVCHDRERTVVHYRVAADGERIRTFALCDECSRPVRELIEQVGPDVRERRPRRPFVDMGQVEAARKRTPAKRAPVAKK